MEHGGGNSPQKLIFNSFYAKIVPSARSDFGSKLKPFGQSPGTSHLRLQQMQVLDSEGNEKQNNDAPRQTLNSAKNYEKINKYSRYEFVGVNGQKFQEDDNSQRESDKGSQDQFQVRYENENSMQGGIMYENSPDQNNQQFLRLNNNPMVQSHAQNMFPQNIEMLQVQNMKPVQSLRSEPHGGRNMMAQQQNYMQAAQKQPSEANYPQNNGKRSSQGSRQSSVKLKNEQKSMNEQVNSPESNKYGVNFGYSQPRMSEAVVKNMNNTSINQSMQFIEDMYNGMVNYLQQDKVRETIDNLRQSTQQDRQDGDVQSEMNRSGSIHYKNLDFNLDQSQQNDFYKVNSNVYNYQGTSNVQLPMEMFDQPMNIIEEIGKLKRLMQRHSDFKNQVMQLDIIMQRYDNTQKDYLALYFQQLQNLIQGVDRTVDNQVLLLLHLLDNFRQSEVALSSMNRYDNKLEDIKLKRDSFESHPHSLYHKDEPVDMIDSDVMDESPTDKNDVLSIKIDQSFKERLTSQSQLPSLSLPRVSTYSQAQNQSQYEERKTVQRKTISQAEEQIALKLSNAQSNLDKQLEQRKKQLEKDQILFFYELCVQIRNEPQFASNPYTAMIEINVLYEKCKDKKILQDQFREFIVAEYTKHINSFAGPSNLEQEESDRPSLAHREKNIFMNKKRNQTPIRGTHMVISNNKIEVIDEQEQEEVEFSEDDGTGKKRHVKVVIQGQKVVKRINSDEGYQKQLETPKFKIHQQQQQGVNINRNQR